MRAISKTEMRLKGYSERRIKELEEMKLHPTLAKAADLEALYAELQTRRADLLREVKREGVVIQVEKSNARGMIYHATITNPAFTALRATEIQIVALAKLIGEESKPAEEKKNNPLEEFTFADDSFDEFDNEEQRPS